MYSMWGMNLDQDSAGKSPHSTCCSNIYQTDMQASKLSDRRTYICMEYRTYS